MEAISMTAYIVDLLGPKRALLIALSLSLCGFVASILIGILWLILSSRGIESHQPGPGLDVAIYIKRVCIPIAAAILLVAFLILRRN